MRITPQDIRLVIMSVWRSPEYIHKTLASLMMSDPLVHQLKGIHIVVGGSDVQYLEQYRHHKRINIHSLTIPENENIKEWLIHRKCCYNYYRCLTIPEMDYHGLCICEDDVVFQDRFVEKMLEAANEMENEHKITKYILDFYLPYGFSPKASDYCGTYCQKISTSCLLWKSMCVLSANCNR